MEGGVVKGKGEASITLLEMHNKRRTGNMLDISCSTFIMHF